MTVSVVLPIDASTPEAGNAFTLGVKEGRNEASTSEVCASAGATGACGGGWGMLSIGEGESIGGVSSVGEDFGVSDISVRDCCNGVLDIFGEGNAARASLTLGSPSAGLSIIQS